MKVTREIVCPNCGKTQRSELYTGINASSSPKLRDAVLSETLFDWKCEACGYFACMAYPFVYVDPVREYAVCLKFSHEAGEDKDASVMQGFKKRVVKNPAEMKEKILIFDGGYDDVAVEIVKSVLCDTIRKANNAKGVHAYFSKEYDGKFEFAVFLPGKDEPVYQSLKMDIYKQARFILERVNFSDPEDFIRVDSKFSKSILLQYKKASDSAGKANK